MTLSSFRRLDRLFQEAGTILLVVHKNPDGDACGSALALFHYLNNLGKRAAIFAVDQPPGDLEFLLGIESFSADRELLDVGWDLAVVLDSSDWAHTGVLPERLNRTTVVNIDHHASNQGFGNFNLVDSQASSVSEIIFYFFEFLNRPIPSESANCLLTGLLSDTGGLTNAATSREALAAAGRLIVAGGKFSAIIKKIFFNRSIDSLRFWGLLLSRLKINRELKLAISYFKEEELKKYHLNEEEAAGFVNFLNIAGEVSAVMFLRIKPGELKASLRTTVEGVDVSRLAGLFGGGGHQKAAGFTVPWTIEERAGRLWVV